jgi:hypothetical protein
LLRQSIIFSVFRTFLHTFFHTFIQMQVMYNIETVIH